MCKPFPEIPKKKKKIEIPINYSKDSHQNHHQPTTKIQKTTTNHPKNNHQPPKKQPPTTQNPY